MSSLPSFAVFVLSVVWPVWADPGGERQPLIAGSLQPQADIPLLLIDHACWDEEFTVDRCCLKSYARSADVGCWREQDQWTQCCRAFVLWRSHASTMVQSDQALGYVLNKENSHEGQIFGRIAARLGYARCVEVGVFGGTWSEFFLAFSTSVDGRLEAEVEAEVVEYTMIDMWIRKEGTELGDGGLDSNLYQAKRMQEAVTKLERFWPRVRFVQQRSKAASRLFDDLSLDFVFVDAGHDECSVAEDLEVWWPKLRSGGLLAGDDYADAETVKEMYGEHQDWSLCENGTVRPGAVLGAVDAFAQERGLQVSVFRIAVSLSPQWLIFKP